MGQEIPSARQYKEAFQVLESLTPNHLNMLRGHYGASSRTATATELSRLVGRESYRVANSLYGVLGRQVGELVGLPPEMKVDVLVIAARPTYGSHPKLDGPHEVWWKMRHQVAEALEILCWVEVKASLPVEEISNHLTLLSEGEAHEVNLTRYERNSRIRRICLEHYGATCRVCDFDFAKIYGEEAKWCSHVHHLRPLSEV